MILLVSYWAPNEVQASRGWWKGRGKVSCNRCTCSSRLHLQGIPLRSWPLDMAFWLSLTSFIVHSILFYWCITLVTVFRADEAFGARLSPGKDPKSHPFVVPSSFRTQPREGGGNDFDSWKRVVWAGVRENSCFFVIMVACLFLFCFSFFLSLLFLFCPYFFHAQSLCMYIHIPIIGMYKEKKKGPWSGNHGYYSSFPEVDSSRRFQRRP